MIADVLWMFDNSLLNLLIFDVSMTKLWSPNQKKWPLIQIILTNPGDMNHVQRMFGDPQNLNHATQKALNYGDRQPTTPKQRTPRNSLPY